MTNPPEIRTLQIPGEMNSLPTKLAETFLTVKPFADAIIQANNALQQALKFDWADLFLLEGKSRYYSQPAWWSCVGFGSAVHSQIPSKILVPLLTQFPRNELTIITKSKNINEIRQLLTETLVHPETKTIIIFHLPPDRRPDGFFLFQYKRVLSAKEQKQLVELVDCLTIYHGAIAQANGIKKTDKTDYHKQYFEQTSEAMFIIKDYTVIECNQKAATFLGLTKESVIGRKPWEFIRIDSRDPKTIKADITALLDATLSGMDQNIPYNYQNNDGTTSNLQIQLVRVESDGEYFLHANFIDITSLKLQQRELSQKATYLESLQEISSRLLAATSLQTVYRAVREVIGEIVPLMAFWVTIWDKKEDVFKTVYLFESNAEIDVTEASPLARNPESQGHGKAAVTGEPVLINDFPKHMKSVTSRIKVGEGKMAGTAFYVPLKNQGEVSGVAVFQHVQKNGFSKRETEIMVSVCTQMATAITNLTLVEQVASNEQRYRYLISHMNDGFLVVGNDNVITLTNDRMAQLVGLPKAENLTGRVLYDFVDETNKRIIEEATNRRRQGLSETYEFSLRHTSGRPVVVSASVSPLYDKDQNVIGAYGLFRDTTKQRMDERQHELIYEISRAANLVESLSELYLEIYRIINRLIDAKNFVLALYQPDKHTISYPFFKDEMDPWPEGEYPVRGLIGYVINNNRPLLINRKGVQAIFRAEGVERIGTIPFYWIGVPMNIESKVIGVLVVQTYDKNVVYTEQHRDVLSIIAGEIARVIERRRARRAIEASDIRYRQIVNNAFEPIVILATENTIRIWNQAAERVFGYSAEEMEGRSLSLIFGDDGLAHIASVQKKIRSGEVNQGGEFIELIGTNHAGGVVEIALSITSLVTEQGFQTTLVMRDITLQKQADRELKEAHSMKEMMLDIISHDLKNPAATISGMAGLLAKEMPDEEPIQVIRMASDSLLDVISSASSLAQLMTEGKIDTQPIEITEIIDSVAASFAVPIRSAKMTLEKHFNGPLFVEANPIISEVFNNYISNAIKYAAAGEKIVIATEQNEDHVTILVKDFGTTLPASEYQRVFERHVQLETGKRRGRGLGLAIVKRIAEAHKAEIGVRANHPQGNIFYITLPLADQAYS